MTAPKVSIIIPTLSAKTKRYLDLCIESIRGLDYPKESLEVILSTPPSYCPTYEGVTTVLHSREREFAEAVNIGVERSDPNSKHIMLLSDDVIMTPDSLKHLVMTAGDSEGLFAGISNCDNYWKYHLAFEVENKGERLAVNERFFRLEDVGFMVPAMMKAKSLYPPGAIRTDTLCFYATLIPRAVWNKLGVLDEGFKTGYEDTDYCERAKRAGIQMHIVLNALIWHFGGVTSSDTLTTAVREQNKKLFLDKWGYC